MIYRGPRFPKPALRSEPLTVYTEPSPRSHAPRSRPDTVCSAVEERTRVGKGSEGNGVGSETVFLND